MFMVLPGFLEGASYLVGCSILELVGVFFMKDEIIGS